MSRHGALDVHDGGRGGRCGGCAGAGAGPLVLVVRDTELCRVCLDYTLVSCCVAFMMYVRTLVLSSAVDDQLNAVVCLVGSKIGARSPVIAASVVDTLDDSFDRYTVGGGTVEKDKRDCALGVRFPGNCERLADRDDAVKTRFIDGVASRVALRSGVGGGQGAKDSEAGGEKGAQRHYRGFNFFFEVRMVMLGGFKSYKLRGGTESDRSTENE